jgi:hypothetical protein
MIAELQDITASMNSNGDSYESIFGTNAWQNLLLDETKFPAVCFDMPKVEYNLPKSGFIGEKYPITIYVCYKSELDWTGLQHEVVIEKANTATRELITRLQNYKDADGNRLIDNIEFVGADRVKNVFNVNTSGIMLQLKIQPTINKAVCIS